MSLIHFLLIYDLRERTLEVKQFRSAAEATEAYGEAELENLDSEDFEIVLVGSDSIETVRKTHGHYFSEGTTVELPELAVI